MLEEYLRNLISFKTVTGENERVHDLFDWLEEQIAALPLFVKRYTFAEGFPALVLTTQETKRPKLWLAAHVDVAGGADALFRAHEKDGQLFGRGANDMKFAVAVYLSLLHALRDELGLLDLGVLLTSDEEIGGPVCIPALFAEGYGGELAFLPDGGGPWAFEESAKGMMRVRLSAQGAAAHGSRPWLGSNAILKLCEVFGRIPEQHTTRCHCNGDEAHWHPTLNIGTIEGGYGFNQVPEAAQAELDIRFTGPAEGAQMRAVLEDAVRAVDGVSMEVPLHIPAYAVSRDHPAIGLFSRIARESQGIECLFAKAHGGSDARHFHARGITTLLIMPTGGGQHTDHEWVDLTDLARYQQVLEQFVRETARVA